MQDECPKRLYHYTSTDAFVKIAQSNELWLTDCRFLNDDREFHFARTIIENTINEHDFAGRRVEFIERVQPHQMLLEQYDIFIENLRIKAYSGLYKQYGSSTLFDVDDPRNSIPYVFSLSCDGDSLDLWRAYGKGQLCIEFDSDKLRRAVDGSLLKKIQYKGEVEVDGKLTRAIDKLISDHTKFSG